MADTANWNDTSETLTANWSTNPTFAASSPTYDDASLTYDSASTYYNGYNPSTQDAENDVNARADWGNDSGTVTANWSDV